MANNNKNVKGKNNPNYKSGYAISGKKAGFYNSWQNMKARCLRVSHPKYHRYGGRGIKVCDEFMRIEGFAKWALNNGWEEGLTLDRIDNDKDYNPDNCMWVTMSKNSRKKSTTKLNDSHIAEIRKMIEEGFSDEYIAALFNVVAGTIWFIRNNYTHTAAGECTERLKRREENKSIAKTIKTTYKIKKEVIMKRSKETSKHAGRPPLGDKALTRSITLKFDKDTDKTLREDAKKIGLGITQYVRMLVFKAIEVGKGK